MFERIPNHSCLSRNDYPRIGDIIIHAGPFLRMYALYIENHSDAVAAITHWKQKSEEFAEIIAMIEKLPECKGVTLEVSTNKLELARSTTTRDLLGCTLGKDTSLYFGLQCVVVDMTATPKQI